MESGQFECCLWLHAVVQGKFVGTQVSAKYGFMSHIFHTERKLPPVLEPLKVNFKFSVFDNVLTVEFPST